MRLSTRALFGAIVLLSVFAVAGCQNPLDPIDKSDKIQGLTWIEINDASLTQWDSDAGNDGMVISLSYKNEFGDELSFHDKPHRVVIEFWTQEGGEPVPLAVARVITRGQLFFSKTIEYENSDDSIRIPYEAYLGELEGVGGFDPEVAFTGMLVVRVFPPQEDPRPELTVAEADIEFYAPETVQGGAQ